MVTFMLFCCSAMAAVSASAIVFPKIDDHPTECKLQDGTNGTCINLKHCASSITAKSVSTCYFDGPDQYVCCKNDLWSDMKGRRLTDGCGIPVFHIVRGIRTEFKEFPYMVALGWESVLSDDTYDYKCGGVLISPKYVLTAAHCASLNGLSPSVALVGGSNLTDSSVKPIKIATAFIHPEYKQSESYHDIALLHLASTASEEAICAWSLYSLDNLNVTAIGYGHTQFAGVGSDSLLKTYLTIVHNNECTGHYSNEDALPRGVIDKQICAKDLENGSDTCQGDSGGPLILHSENPEYEFTAPFVVGITSFGQACALDPPGVYTRVSEYIDWIESVIYTD